MCFEFSRVLKFVNNCMSHTIGGDVITLSCEFSFPLYENQVFIFRILEVFTNYIERDVFYHFYGMCLYPFYRVFNAVVFI